MSDDYHGTSVWSTREVSESPSMSGMSHGSYSDEERTPLSSWRLCSRTYPDDSWEESEDDEVEDIEDAPADYVVVLEKGLPKWSHPRLMKDLAVRWAEDKNAPVPLSFAAGQAIPLAWYCAATQWTFYLCYMLLTRHISICNPENIEIAKYPWWSWTAVIPVLVSSLLFEWCALQWIIVPKYQVLRRLLWTCIPIRSYRLWLFLSLMVSALHVCTFATDSAFLGVVIKTSECPGGVVLEQMWDAMLEQSYLNFADGMMGVLPSMETVCGLIWASAFLQLFFALGESVPVGADAQLADFEVAYMSKDAHEEDVKYKTDYPTCCRKISCNPEKQNHGASLMVMAEVTGMSTVVKQDLDYAMEKARLALKTQRGEYELNILNHVRSQMRRSILKTFLAGFCGSALQVHVQITILAMRAALNHKSVYPTQLQGLLAIVFAMVMFLIRVCDCINITMNCRPWGQVVERCYLERGQDKYDERFKNAIRTYNMNMLLLFCVCLLCFGLLLWAIVKIFAAFSCPDHVWNFSGCVDFSGITSTNGGTYQTQTYSLQTYQ